MNLYEVIANSVYADEEGHIWEGKVFDVATAVRKHVRELIRESEGDVDLLMFMLNKR